MLASASWAQKFDVHLSSRTLSGGTEPELIAKLQDPSTHRVHAVLRFRAPLSADQHRVLRDEGIVLLSYLENNGYLASIPAGARLGEGALAPLGGANLLRPPDKLDRALTDARARWFVLGSDRFAVVVEFFPDVTPEEARAILAPLSPRASRAGPVTWSVELTHDSLQRLASQDSVKRLYPGPRPALALTEVQRAVTRSDDAQQADFSAPRPVYRVDGSPVRIGICDDGIDDQHADFAEVLTDGSLGALRIDPKRPVSSIHGTRVASIAASSGYMSEANLLGAFERRGHAPYARLGDFPPFGVQIDAVYDALVTHGMHVTNHSYAQSMSVYDWVAVELDRIVRGDASFQGTPIPARPQVWAAGNNGTEAQYPGLGGYEAGYHSVYTTAKNTISVGSVHAPDDDLSGFSSLGPTFDGRIKPDLVAPGCRSPAGIMAAGGYQTYLGGCGTSMAAPAVTGIVALMMHQHLSHGVSATLLPSTYKAMLVHTAKDLAQRPDSPNAQQFVNPDTGERVQFHVGPDFATGWGRVDAEAAREIVTLSNQWREDEVDLTQGQDECCVEVVAGASEIKATLAWDDLPGDSSTLETVPKLVNDLDLLLVAPSGDAVLPWTIVPLPLTEAVRGQVAEGFTASDVVGAYRGVDHLNNVEMVNAVMPSPGTWRIRVTAHQLPMGTAQKYSLVISDPISEACP